MNQIKTKLVGVVLPVAWIEQIETELKPMQNLQDYIRDCIREKIELEKVEA